MVFVKLHISESKRDSASPAEWDFEESIHSVI
jgi:hypothetical protein